MKSWGGGWHNGMVTKAISACFIRAEGNWKARSRIPRSKKSGPKWGEEIWEDPVPRKNSFEGKGTLLSYVEIGNRIFRISIGNSAHFVLCWWKFWKANFAISTFAEFRDGRAGFEVRERVMKMRGEESRRRVQNSAGWKRGWIRGRIVNEQEGKLISLGCS